MINDMQVVCPLSGSPNLVVQETIEVEAITKLYSRLLKCDISSEFRGIQTINFYHCLDSDLKFFYPMVTGSESFYKQLQQFDWYYMDEKEEYDYASHYIKNEDIVLEVGCGKGAFSRKIETPNYTGLEFSRDAIEIASKANIKILNEFVEDHSNSNSEIYDTVCSFQVLEHVAKPNSFIESCLKCLKPGGLLIFSVPSDDSFIGSLTNNIMNIPPHHVTRWTDKTLKYVADYFGIRLIDIHHEKLADVHKRLYANHFMLKSLENSLGIEKKSSLLEMSIPYKIMSKISSLFALVIVNGLKDEKLKPIGHSVTVVYQK